MNEKEKEVQKMIWHIKHDRAFKPKFVKNNAEFHKIATRLYRENKLYWQQGREYDSRS